MKNYKIKYAVFFLIWLQIFCGNLAAQNYPQERIVTHLSEHCLLAGETLWFSVMVSCRQDVAGGYLSNFAFVELVDSSGRSVMRDKILLKDGSGSGLFALPDSLPTGNYLFVAYTSWLRNFGEDFFAVKKLLVVRQGDELNISSSEKKGFKATAEEKAASANVFMQIPNEQFQPREKVQVNLGIRNSDSATVSVAVRKKEPELKPYSSKKIQQVSAPNAIIYLPDYKGILLSGHVRNNKNNEPLPNNEIYLSFPGRNVEIKRAVSEDDGKFHFLLHPETGEKDMVFTLESENAGIWLDDRFAGNLELDITDSFSMSQEQEDYFTKKFVNRQLQERFGQLETSSVVVPDSSGKYVFYSKPYQVLELKDYIRLDSLREYFYELIPTVHINRRNNKYLMHLTNPRNNFTVGENPALFVDGVYYPYPGELMRIDVNKVERVEVIPEVYYYRRMTFDGIVSVFTRDRDFMDIPLQPNMFRIFYEMAAPSSNFIPKVYVSDTEETNLPDLRWLLHWQPRIEISKNEPIEFEFFTGDLKGEFEISVSGMNNKGEIIQLQKSFRVE